MCRTLRYVHNILQCFIPSLPAIESLGAALGSLPHGLSELSLANCRILPRGQHQQVLLPDCAQLYHELERVIYMRTHLPPLSNPSHRWVPLGKLHEAEQNNAVFSGPLGPLWHPLGPDPQGALTFLQEPNTIARLNLSKCGINFEFVRIVHLRCALSSFP